MLFASCFHQAFRFHNLNCFPLMTKCDKTLLNSSDPFYIFLFFYSFPFVLLTSWKRLMPCRLNRAWALNSRNATISGPLPLPAWTWRSNELRNESLHKQKMWVAQEPEVSNCNDSESISPPCKVWTGKGTLTNMQNIFLSSFFSGVMAACISDEQHSQRLTLRPGESGEKSPKKSGGRGDMRRHEATGSLHRKRSSCEGVPGWSQSICSCRVRRAEQFATTLSICFEEIRMCGF